MSLIQSDLLINQPRIRHLFCTREGGVSSGVYSSLNCGLSSADDAENVRANRDIALGQLEIPGAQLVTSKQVHSAKAVYVGTPLDKIIPEADGLVTNKPGLVLGIITADCAPILLADSTTGVIGAAHAGWRGALGGIIESTVKLMCDYGAIIENINCAIGPCIGKESYEVGAEFMDKFIEHSNDNNKFFKPASISGKFFFDLSSYTFCRLEATGVSQISQLDFDTCSDQDRFFSYRRYMVNSEEDFGRGISLIGITDK